MKNQKGFVPVIIILIVLVGFVGVYFLGKGNSKLVVESPTSTPVVSTLPMSINLYDPDYSNDFTFTLPEKWYRYRKQSLNPIQYLNYDPETCMYCADFDPTRDRGKLKIEIYAYQNVQDLDQFLSFRNLSNVVSKKQISLDNMPAYLIEFDLIYIRYSEVITVNSITNRGYSMLFGLDFENYKPLRDQILSTFKFTN